MADFESVNNARKILQLEREANLDEIKGQFRKLSKKYHPDSCKNKNIKECEEKFKEINDAYKIVLEYVGNYKYSFEKEDIKKTKIEKLYREHIKRFYDGWWDEL